METYIALCKCHLIWLAVIHVLIRCIAYCFVTFMWYTLIHFYITLYKLFLKFNQFSLYVLSFRVIYLWNHYQRQRCIKVMSLFRMLLFHRSNVPPSLKLHIVIRVVDCFRNKYVYSYIAHIVINDKSWCEEFCSVAKIVSHKRIL